MGAHYLSRFIGDEKSKRNCLKYQMNKWGKNIRAITKMSEKHPRESYAVVIYVI